MSYFKWSGVDITGAIKKGKLIAYSQTELSQRLFHQGIALLDCKQALMPLLFRSISADEKADLFNNTAHLLRAGIMLPPALEMAAAQSSHPFLHDLFFSLSKDMQKGISFVTSLQTQKEGLIDAIMCNMLISGYESSDLIKAFEYCASYCQRQAAFRKNIRAVLAMPLLTFLFFAVVSGFIFLFIIPRFAQMFNSLGHDLPLLTQTMIQISNFIRSGSMIYLIVTVVGIVLLVYHYGRTKGKKSYDTLIMAIPFVGKIVHQYHWQQLFQALALLTAKGIPISSALEVSMEGESNYVIKQQLSHIEHAVACGQLLSDALMISGAFLPEVIAIVRIGEESGTLSQGLDYAASLYNAKVHKSLRYITFYMQPITVLILGFLITIVIFSVYLPIIELSRVV